MTARSFNGPRTPVWNMGVAATQTFFPVTPFVPTRGITELKVSVLEMDATTGHTTENLVAEVAFQTSDDGQTWGAAAVVDTTPLSVNTNEKIYGAAWIDQSTALNAKRFVRFGILTDNKATTTTLDTAYVSFVVEGR